MASMAQQREKLKKQVEEEGAATVTRYWPAAEVEHACRESRHVWRHRFWCVGPVTVGSLHVRARGVTETRFSAQFDWQGARSGPLPMRFEALWHCARGMGADREQGLGKWCSRFRGQATRRSVTMGRCFCPASNVTTTSSRTPGWPLTSVWGLAQCEPRGHLVRGSKRGVRLAGRRAK